ncbi:flavodoxin/nitric oxide synthase [Pseudoxanthomonas sp. CF125]|uniref:flavodoxin family protein n=1 Tax=Pseudoxanthomonas sp. CF125 TaxID=1855303 RepID=UPI00088385DE|nr:flavodoxin/nitric oxide synthase [Pseudoxanthomonas sp. CF125]SDQ81526.1 Flavodoxin [Pseudoxanthomonas sp. CF125]
MRTSNHVRKKKMFLVGLVATVMAVAAVALVAIKDRTYVPSGPYSPVGKPNQEIAVVYYSRSGHTEAVAREIARMFNAPIARIEADYPLGFKGQGDAITDARAQALPRIQVGPIDLAPAKRVFLLSPTWMFRPATPLWAYVEQTDLSGKEVVLIMTGNSRYKQKEVNAFAKRIEAHGGHLIHHAFLRRGRVYWQKSREELTDDARVEVAKIE